MPHPEPSARRLRHGIRGLPAVATGDGAVAGLAAATGVTGIATSVVVTTASLFLADAVHAAPLMIGLFFAGRGVAEVGTDLAIGVVSDRLRSRRALLALCCVLSALGALSYLLLRNYYALFVTGALFFGTGGASFAQVFAYTSEFARARGYSVTGFNSVLRAVNSAAWVLGPPVGFYLLSRASFASVYGMVAVLYVAGAALCQWALPLVPGQACLDPGERDGRGFRQPFAGLSAKTYLLLGSVLLLAAVTSIYQIVIALHVTKDLRLDTVVTGWLMGLCAALEIPAAILIGARAERIGKLRLTAVAAAGAALFSCALPFAVSVPALLALQIPNAAWTAVVMSIPVVLLQEDVPDRVGVASSLYAMAFKGGVLLGGSVAGVTAAAVGYVNVFWVSAGLAAAAALLLMARAWRPG
jgi:SET family sugar efflux transporter-like MFS transporter